MKIQNILSDKELDQKNLLFGVKQPEIFGEGIPPKGGSQFHLIGEFDPQNSTFSTPMVPEVRKTGIFGNIFSVVRRYYKP